MKEALRNIWRRKVRSLLTIFGIAIGIFALVAMGSLSENLNKSINTTLDYYSNRITVTAESAGSAGNAGLFSQGGQVPISLVDRIKVVDGVSNAYPTITLPLESGELATFSYPPVIYAFPPEETVKDPKKLPLKSGRELKEGDEGKVVVGSSIVQERKLDIGQKVELKGKTFEVIGILSRTGGAPDGFFSIPLNDAQAMLEEATVFNPEAATLVTDIQVIPESGTNSDELADTIKSRFRGVSAIPPESFKKQIEQASSIFNLIILGSALIAVVVGGLSVINTMVMAISERRREIGVKRVVGAKTRHILGELMTETTLIGLIGGLLGLVFGGILVYFINQATSDRGIEVFTLTPRLAIGSVMFAVLLGWLAGIYPAWRASRIKPVEVLREE